MKQRIGISLITLVITIVIVVILIGVDILSISNNNPINAAMEANFLNNIKTVEEATTLYRVSNSNKLPISDKATFEKINKEESLKEEIAYYRIYKATGSTPDIGYNADAEFIETPNGLMGLYYINTKEIGASGIKTEYILDTNTGIIFDTKGININKQIIHTKYFMDMAKGNLNASLPNTDRIEDNQTINKLDYQLVSDSSNNLFKVYENGDVYSKGKKSEALGSGTDELNRLDKYKWQEFKVPAGILSVKTIIPGNKTIFVKEILRSRTYWTR